LPPNRFVQLPFERGLTPKMDVAKLKRANELAAVMQGRYSI